MVVKNTYDILQAIDLTCGDIGKSLVMAGSPEGFFPCCLAKENIACDVDEVLWPDPEQTRDAEAG